MGSFDERDKCVDGGTHTNKSASHGQGKGGNHDVSLILEYWTQWGRLFGCF